MNKDPTASEKNELVKDEEGRNEFPEGKENYCPRCYFEYEIVTLRKGCPHYLLSSSPSL